MKELFFKLRNSLLRSGYYYIAKPLFFRMDPETIHDRMIVVGKFLGSYWITKKIISFLFSYSHKSLEQNILKMKFKNPLGLAAGFDKNAQIYSLLSSLGFGFAELGSITGLPCAGNAKPRLWRLKRLKGLVVYYGLKNDGCKKISLRLKNKRVDLPLGASIAKTNCMLTVNKSEGIADYVRAFKVMKNVVNYLTINISCPNAYGGQPFTNPKDLDDLLTQIDKIFCHKPIFLKITPDLTMTELDALLDVCDKHRIHGFIFSNLTKKRDSKVLQRHLLEDNIPAVGGISGPILKYSSKKLISHTYKRFQKKYVLIGCGGVSSAQDAYDLIKSGASLIQLITGMIYEGPQVLSEINQGIFKLLRKDGYEKISDAIGKA